MSVWKILCRLTIVEMLWPLHFFSVAILIFHKRRRFIISSMYSNFCQNGRQTIELPAIELPKNTPICVLMGKMVSTVTYLRTIQSILRICLLLGDRSLPFGLLVLFWHSLYLPNRFYGWFSSVDMMNISSNLLSK